MPSQLTSAFVEGQLRYIRKAIIDFPMPEYMGANGLIVPISNEIPIGASSYLYYIRTLVGEAQIIANPADDLPTADVFLQQKTGIIHDVGDSYRYSDKDLEAASFAGVNLTLSKATAAKQAALIKMDKICYIGDLKYNLLGLLNQPNVPVASILADGLGGSTRWAAKTPTQVLRDLRDISTIIPVQTNLVERPDTLLLPPTQYYYAAQTYKDPVSDMTILNAFLQTQGMNGITNIEMVPYLRGAGVGGTDMGAVYKRREDKAKFHIPMPFTPKNPQERNLHYVVPCRMTTGGVEVTFPGSITYFQGI